MSLAPSMSSAIATERDPRWAAVRDRDPSADGEFVYAVRTTGVYCRPSCPSRLARPANVTFFATRDAAEAAGYRACLRCRPRASSQAERQVALVTAACRLIESAEEMPGLAELAASVGLSAFHFHRIFKQVTGLTPKAYGAGHRTARMREGLVQAGTSVTSAIYDAGFQSNSRFYATSNAVLGMTPRAFKAGGSDVTIRFAIGACSLGAILVACSAKGVCAILLGDDPAVLLQDLQNRFPKANLIGGDGDFESVVAAVVGLVDAPTRGLDLPLDLRGTAFQQRVWQALRAVPAGATASYAEIAKAIGAPRAVRAVAQACGANPVAVAVPCHRVVRQDGALSGYRWGIERKRALLAREASS